MFCIVVSSGDVKFCNGTEVGKLYIRKWKSGEFAKTLKVVCVRGNAFGMRLYETLKKFFYRKVTKKKAGIVTL